MPLGVTEIIQDLSLDMLQTALICIFPAHLHDVYKKDNINMIIRPAANYLHVYMKYFIRH